MHPQPIRLMQMNIPEMGRDLRNKVLHMFVKNNTIFKGHCWCYFCLSGLRNTSHFFTKWKENTIPHLFVGYRKSIHTFCTIDCIDCKTHTRLVDQLLYSLRKVLCFEWQNVMATKGFKIWQTQISRISGKRNVSELVSKQV